MVKQVIAPVGLAPVSALLWAHSGPTLNYRFQELVINHLVDFHYVFSCRLYTNCLHQLDHKLRQWYSHRTKDSAMSNLTVSGEIGS